MARILLVDDEPSVRLFYSAVLADEGYDVVEAPSGAEALRLLDAEPPDLIVLDIRLRSQSGLELLQHIASHPARVPVIILTAYASFQDDYTTWLAESYVLKSSDPTEFLAEVHRVLDRRMGRSANLPLRPRNTVSDALFPPSS
ncbi:Sporulation initiation phosphotransferase F [bacterium HR08]|nr:Sporulation initiation phosphotransferase F [bacterium HR08]